MSFNCHRSKPNPRFAYFNMVARSVRITLHGFTPHPELNRERLGLVPEPHLLGGLVRNYIKRVERR